MTPEFQKRDHPDTIVLFDVDGTITPARQEISESMKQTLAKLRKKVVVGFVGGSDLAKQKEQIGEDVLDLFDYCFSENGLTAYKLNQQLASQSFIGFLGEERYQKLCNFVLRYLSDISLPVKRHPERDQFEAYDKIHKIRAGMVDALKKNFPDYGLIYSIGGQISFDVMPAGWDKTYCLRHLEGEGFTKIHFFGDKTFEGGNDYEIYTDPTVEGHSVTCPEDTQKILGELFGI
ncbi:Phosphomannomutase [Podochytrium sp. JEL0797]|nr:Phosphomannomutase [Podochytrium sp. JEL0797]